MGCVKMKKSAALGLVLVLCASQAWAYENSYAGYSVKDKNPAIKMESNKIYAFSGITAKSWDKLEKQDQGSVHIVNYYTAEEMSQILGEKFTTAYFNAQYDKLAVLKTAELDLQTVPLDLLNLKKYTDFEDKKGNLWHNKFAQEQFSKISPTVRIDKFNGNKTITVSYLYKRNNSLVNAESTLVSKNDKMYILTTMSANTKVFTPKEEIADAQDNAIEDNAIGIIGGADGPTAIYSTAKMETDQIALVDSAVQKALAIESISPTEVDTKVLEQFWKTHTKFVKNVKLFAATSKEHTLTYTDNITNKQMNLPKDWFYGQAQFDLDDEKGNFTIAGALPTIHKINNRIDCTGVLDMISEAKIVFAEAKKNKDDANAQIRVADVSKKLQAKLLEESHKVLGEFDAGLFTASIKTKDQKLEGFTNDLTFTDKLALEQSIAKGLQRIQAMSNDKFALTSYNYNLDFSQDKASLDIDADVKLLNTFDFKDFFHLILVHEKNDTIGSFLLYTYKDDFSQKEILSANIEKWKF